MPGGFSLNIDNIEIGPWSKLTETCIEHFESKIVWKDLGNYWVLTATDFPQRYLKRRFE